MYFIQLWLKVQAVWHVCTLEEYTGVPVRVLGRVQWNRGFNKLQRNAIVKRHVYCLSATVFCTSWVKLVCTLAQMSTAHLPLYFKVPLTVKMSISVNEAVPWVQTNGDTKCCYTYVQIAKNLQLPVDVLLKVSHFLDDVTRGTVCRVNVLQMRILILHFGSETLAYHR